MMTKTMAVGAMAIFVGIHGCTGCSGKKRVTTGGGTSAAQATKHPAGKADTQPSVEVTARQGATSMYGQAVRRAQELPGAPAGGAPLPGDEEKKTP